MLKVAGKDATEEFNKFHNVVETLRKYGPQLYKGDIGTAAGSTDGRYTILDGSKSFSFSNS